MTLGEHAGHFERHYAAQPEFVRQLREFLVRIDALHGRDHAVSAAKSTGKIHEFRQVGKGARNHEIEFPRWLPGFDTLTYYVHIVEPELDHSLAQKCGFLVIA